MSDALVRQWGPNCYAAYVVGDGPYPDFVGTAETRELAIDLAESCCAASGVGAIRTGVGGRIGGAQRERLQRSTAGLDPNPDLTRK